MLKFILSAVFVVLIIIIAIIFWSRNETEVAVDLLLSQPISLGVGLWVLISFITGCFVMWIVAWPSHFASKIINKKQSRKLKAQQEEIVRLKGESSKGI